MTARLDDIVAIVTGGTGALGQAISRLMLARGARVCVPFVVHEEAAALRASLAEPERQRLHAAQADVTAPARVDAFVTEVVDRFGRIDALINGVGGFAGGDLVATTPDLWNRMLTLNLTSAYVATHAVLPVMLRARAGRVISIGSRAVVPPAGGFIAYTVAKAGVIALTQALAKEVRSHGITANAVLPSTMDTPANRAAMPDADRSQWVSVESVAEVVVFLTGPVARDINGALIAV
jgi:NAD(P)-dependent dehydrogenase (short-subunit alcohol dehydrogenase family)